MGESTAFVKICRGLSDLLKEKSYDDISVKDISEACGFSRQNFYKHFENKEALIHEIFTRCINSAIKEDVVYSFRKATERIIMKLQEKGEIFAAVYFSFKRDFILELFRDFTERLMEIFTYYSTYRSLNEKEKQSLSFYSAAVTVTFFDIFTGKLNLDFVKTARLFFENMPAVMQKLMTEEGITGEYILYKLR